MTTGSEGHRTLRLTAASSVRVRPVEWLWDSRVPVGALTLLGGREGIGKSTVACTLVAAVTLGSLPGAYFGEPKAVLIVATEDSWEHTIVPRLMAAGADLDRVYRVEVETAEGVESALSLPRDLHGVEEAIRHYDVALLLLDPFLSRLASTLDTHKDAEVRLALEPLVAVAMRTGVSVLGLIHVSKSTSVDPLTLLMASRAFAAVARAVLFMMVDPEDPSIRLLGQPKNNLGRDDLPTLTLTIETAQVAVTEEGPVTTACVRWLGQSNRSVRDAIEETAAGSESRSAVEEAGEWLRDFLVSRGGSADSAEVKREGKKAGHSEGSLKRSRSRVKVRVESYGFPRSTRWVLSGNSAPPVSRNSLGESGPTD